MKKCPSCGKKSIQSHKDKQIENENTPMKIISLFKKIKPKNKIKTQKKTQKKTREKTQEKSQKIKILTQINILKEL